MHSMRGLSGYNVIFQPTSDYAMTSNNWVGWVFEHMWVIEISGDSIPSGFEVHHLDGNRQNNRRENLIVVSKGDHTRLHNWLDGNDIALIDISTTPEPYRECGQCGVVLSNNQRSYCSTTCQNQHRSKRPPQSELSGLTIERTSAKYNVTQKTARSWFHHYGMVWKYPPVA